MVYVFICKHEILQNSFVFLFVLIISEALILGLYIYQITYNSLACCFWHAPPSV